MTTISVPRLAPDAMPPPADTSDTSRAPDAIVPDTDPRWVRPALILLLVGTAGIYLWGLGASGWANSFYSAAVQAGTKSWKAFFFGSSDAANFISIDKPPAALWVMEISARLFGVNAWSILVPQALEGVATVALLYATVRRWFGAGAGLLAGLVVATTPVAALMFRFNDPDAFLVLLLTAAAYALVRALEAGRTRWLVAAATLIGFGFITKMLQAIVVVPVFALAYLIAAPTQWRRRIWQLLVAGVALAVASLWWVVAVQLVPASDRPYIGGSQNNSLWDLIFGYNGFGRLTGNEAGSVVGGGGTGGSQWGPTGLLRLFNSQFGGQGSWLIPAAVILLAAGLALTWQATRTDRTRAALIIWGGWLLVTGAVFSLGQGIIHPYYTVALAPAIGALVGIGGTAMWARRDAVAARAVLAGALVATAAWSYLLLGRTPAWHPWLRQADLAAGLALAVIILVWRHLGKRVAVAAAAAALVIALAGQASYTVATVSAVHSGAIPSAGPAGAGGFAPGGFGPGGAGPGGRTLQARGPQGAGAFATGGLPGAGPPPGAPAGVPFGAGPAGPGQGPGRAGGLGGLLNGSTPSTAVVAALTRGHRYTWVAAAVGSNAASGYQLATGEPVLAIGGFNGTDPAPTLTQFERYVHQGKIHYFIAGQGGFAPAGAAGAPGGSPTSSAASQITTWVESHFTTTTVGGVTLYDLSSPTS